MCTIKLYGPASIQFEMLHRRIVEVLESARREAEIVLVQDISDIMSADITEVPMAILEGRSPTTWSIRTTMDEMMSELIREDLFASQECKCGGLCKKQKSTLELDPCHNRVIRKKTRTTNRLVQ